MTIESREPAQDPVVAEVGSPLRSLAISGDHMVLLLLLLGSLGLNLYLGNKLWAVPPMASTYEKGDALPELSLSDLAGTNSTLAFDGEPRPTVLYVFSPSCPWCKKNTGAVNALHRGVGDRYRFLGLSLESEGLEEFVSKAGIDFATYVVGGSPAHQFAGVPETLVLSEKGVVLERWPGAYATKTLTEIEEYFEIEGLPSLEVASTASW